jgi:hypothetical protein
LYHLNCIWYILLLLKIIVILRSMVTYKNFNQGYQCGSVVEHFSRIHEVLGLLNSTEKNSIKSSDNIIFSFPVSGIQHYWHLNADVWSVNKNLFWKYFFLIIFWCTAEENTGKIINRSYCRSSFYPFHRFLLSSEPLRTYLLTSHCFISSVYSDSPLYLLVSPDWNVTIISWYYLLTAIWRRGDCQLPA